MFFLRTLTFIHFSIFLLILIISSCAHLYEKGDLQLELSSSSVNKAKTPQELQLLLGTYPEISPEQFMLRFKSHVSFNDWMHSYPLQMVKVIGRFPLNSSRQLTTKLFTYWVDKSHNASEACIESELKDSPLRDSAIEGMVNGLKSDHLSTAVAWAHEIKDESKRYQLLESLATQ